jgi:tRNA dimethylallyltransferase
MRVCVLDPGKEPLDARIEARTRALIDAGLDDEARRLREDFPGAAVLGSLGYREALQFLDGQLPQAELANAITRATRHYARRQRTWFKKEPGATFFVDAAQIE